MKVGYVEVGMKPRIAEVEQDEDGSYLHGLQSLVGGNIEQFPVLYGDQPVLYVNEDGIGLGLEPNGVVYATRQMEEQGYLSQLDFGKVCEEGQFYSVLFGPIVAVSYDEEGQARDISESEFGKVMADFGRGTGMGRCMEALEACIAIQEGGEPGYKPGWEWKYAPEGQEPVFDGEAVMSAEPVDGYVYIEAVTGGMQTLPLDAFAQLRRDVADYSKAFTGSAIGGVTMREWSERGARAREELNPGIDLEAEEHDMRDASAILSDGAGLDEEVRDATLASECLSNDTDR